MDYDFERWVRLYGLIECTGLGNVLHYYIAEFVFWDVLMVVEDCLAFLGCADCCNDGVASFEKYVKDVGSYETGAACDQCQWMY